MIVEVVGGADEVPEVRVEDVDDLTRLHLAVGALTDEDVDSALRDAGMGRLVDGDNGVLFGSQTSRGIRMAIRRFERLTWTSARIAGDATARYGRARFRDRMRAVLEETLR